MERAMVIGDIIENIECESFKDPETGENSCSSFTEAGLVFEYFYRV